MKKYLTFLILAYLLFTINSKAHSQNTNSISEDSKEIIKIGVLIPLTGEYKDLGQSILNAIKLGVAKKCEN